MERTKLKARNALTIAIVFFVIGLGLGFSSGMIYTLNLIADKVVILLNNPDAYERLQDLITRYFFSSNAY